jgi:hypothetical protein
VLGQEKITTIKLFEREKMGLPSMKTGLNILRLDFEKDGKVAGTFECQRLQRACFPAYLAWNLC